MLISGWLHCGWFFIILLIFLMFPRFLHWSCDLKLEKQFYEKIASFLSLSRYVSFLCAGENLDLAGTEALLIAFLLPFPPGKTAAFALPVLERLIYKPRQAPVTRVLVLVPTRELGIQVHSVTKQLAQFCSITTCLAVGECLAKGWLPLRDSDMCRWMYPTSKVTGTRKVFMWLNPLKNQMTFFHSR